MTTLGYFVQSVQSECCGAKDKSTQQKEDVEKLGSGKGNANEDGGDHKASIAKHLCVFMSVSKGVDENENIEQHHHGEKVLIENVVYMRGLASVEKEDRAGP